jgi:predicted metal-dependent hydrolase
VTVHQPSLFDAPAPFEVRVVRSTRRKKTVGAQLRGGTLVVTVPSWMSTRDERTWVDEMVRRFTKKRRTDGVDLAARAGLLARRYDLPPPARIEWRDMDTRWGSCTPGTGRLRLSSALASYPGWVLDYVLVHELAHLVHADHSPAFWALVNRYPLAERARGYLIAKSGDAPDD